MFVLIGALIAVWVPATLSAQEAATEPATETGVTEAAESEPCEGDDCPPDEEAEKEPEDTRARFEFDVDSGKAVLLAENVRFQPGEFLLADGRVEIRYQDVVLTADLARFDVASELLTAEGHVILDEGPQRISGDTLEYNLADRTGRLSNAKAHLQPDYFFEGAELAKTGPISYSITDGVFTSCEANVPPWSIAMSSAKVTLEKYVKIKNARLRFKNVPALYVPYMLWPAKTDRASGFLVPKPGFSSRRGVYLGLAYFQTLGRSADVTLFADGYGKGYFGGGLEARWRPSENSSGFLQGYFISEPTDQSLASLDNPDGEFRPIFDPFRQAGDDRWKVALFHETNNLWKNFRGVVNFVDYSDFDYQGDYEGDIRRSARPYIYSNAYLSGNFGNHSLNILVDRRERISRDRIDLRHQLPEVEYRLRPTQLGRTPIYLSLLSSANYFRIESVSDNRAPAPSFEYGRADFLPLISIPLSTVSWLSAKVSIGGRVTHYTDSLTDDRRDFRGDSLTRTFATAGLEVVGPSFSRIFEKGTGRFQKFKHVVEPRINYLFVDDFDDQLIVPAFDEVDSLFATNAVEFSITNRLIAKPAAKVDEDGEELPEEGAFEIATFTIAQQFSLDDEKPLQRSNDGILDTTDGVLRAALRFNPSRRTSLRADATYSTLFNRVQATSLTGGVALGAYSEVGATWFTSTRPEDGLETRNQAQLFLKLALVPGRLFLDTAHRFDLRDEEEAVVEERVLDQIYSLRWEGSCFTMRFDYSENNFLNAAGDEFRFLLTLKHVGNFLDINGF